MADAVLVAHVGVAAFLIVGQAVIVVGGILGSAWVRNVWFRLAHLGLIVFIAGQTLLGRICPLTSLEDAFRLKAGQPLYVATSTQVWLSHILFFEAPSWTFTMAHTLAAVVILVSWLAVPPTWHPQRKTPNQQVARRLG